MSRKRIVVEFVRQDQQRYPTVGDYCEDGDSIHFNITDMRDPVHSMAILLHELVERSLNQLHGITDAMVDAWDMAHLDHPDPGLPPDSPYHRTHMCADAVERLFIALANKDWVEYEAEIDELFNNSEDGEENCANGRKGGSM